VSEPAIVAEGVSKRYRLRRERRRTLKEQVLRQYGPSDAVEALRDVSFSVARGEAFGVIGQNGSGKSTLLKLMAGTAKPTSGRLETHGRVSALLELGAGFHPDFSGRENAYLNGSLLGLSKRDMDQKMPSIEDFADLGRFFDAAVKTYSSGMYMRLGFAVAVHVDPCFAKIAEFRRAKKTIVLVSHDLGSVARLCERAIWLDGGTVAASGSVRDVANAYHLKVSEKEQRERAARGEIGKRWGSKEIEITSTRVLGPDGVARAVLQSGEPAAIEIAYRNGAGVSDAVFGVFVYRDDGVGVYGTNTLIDSRPVHAEPEGVVRFRIEALELLPGGYDVDIGIIDPQDRYYDYREKGLSFRVISGTREIGLSRIAHRWESQ
jgi:ABC-2 type transport system ATP-binding protein/lipopolysaccharide transport system ATP-binding protein